MNYRKALIEWFEKTPPAIIREYRRRRLSKNKSVLKKPRDVKRPSPPFIR